MKAKSFLFATVLCFTVLAFSSCTEDAVSPKETTTAPSSSTNQNSSEVLSRQFEYAKDRPEKAI